MFGTEKCSDFRHVVLQTTCRGTNVSAKPLCLSVQHHTWRLEETFSNLNVSMIL